MSGQPAFRRLTRDHLIIWQSIRKTVLHHRTIWQRTAIRSNARGECIHGNAAYAAIHPKPEEPQSVVCNPFDIPSASPLFEASDRKKPLAAHITQAAIVAGDPPVSRRVLRNRGSDCRAQSIPGSKVPNRRIAVHNRQPSRCGGPEITRLEHQDADQVSSQSIPFCQRSDAEMFPELLHMSQSLTRPNPHRSIAIPDQGAYVIVRESVRRRNPPHRMIRTNVIQTVRRPNPKASRPFGRKT
jgi:hypothetical protein